MSARRERSPTVLLIGTLDTKGKEYAYLRDRIREREVDVLLDRRGILDDPLTEPDVTRQEVAAAAGADVRALADARDRSTAIEAMSRGAAEIVLRLHAEGRFDAVGALGGTGGTALATHAMQRLPVGVPKLMVSTAASGDTSRYFGPVDVTMMHSVVDIAGLNTILTRILRNAASALVGMATAHGASARRGEAVDRRLDVRRDDAVCDGGARAAGGARLRGARLPPGRPRRPLAGGGGEDRRRRRRARRHAVGAGRRDRRRHLACGPRAARGRRPPGHPDGRLARRRSTSSPSARPSRCPPASQGDRSTCTTTSSPRRGRLRRSAGRSRPPSRTS